LWEESKKRRDYVSRLLGKRIFEEVKKMKKKVCENCGGRGFKLVKNFRLQAYDGDWTIEKCYTCGKFKTERIARNYLLEKVAVRIARGEFNKN